MFNITKLWTTLIFTSVDLWRMRLQEVSPAQLSTVWWENISANWNTAIASFTNSEDKLTLSLRWYYLNNLLEQLKHITLLCKFFKFQQPNWLKSAKLVSLNCPDFFPLIRYLFFSQYLLTGLSRIFCDNNDGTVTFIQPHAFSSTNQTYVQY